MNDESILVYGFIILLIIGSFIFGYYIGNNEGESQIYRHFDRINIDGQIYKLNRTSDYCIYPDYYPIDYPYLWMQICIKEMKYPIGVEPRDISIK